MRIALGCDHAGYLLKIEVLNWLKEWGHAVQDLGAHNLDPVDDYPDYAEPVARAVSLGNADRGIIICGSGVGASIVANKVIGVRAAMCHDVYSARQGVEHDSMNVLCLGSRIVGDALARDLLAAFLGARFSEDERHVRRLNKLIAIESQKETSS